jgi:hypothetical protein
MAEDPKDSEHQAAIDLMDQVMYLVGQVVNAWAILDNNLIWLIAKIAKCPTYSAGIIYYSLNAFASRLAIAKGLTQHNIDDEQRKLGVLNVLERLRSLSNTRNDIVHAEFKIVHDSKRHKKWRVTKHLFRAERQQLITEADAQIGELRDHLKRVNAITRELYALHHSFPSRKRSSSRKKQHALR